MHLEWTASRGGRWGTRLYSFRRSAVCLSVRVLSSNVSCVVRCIHFLQVRPKIHCAACSAISLRREAVCKTRNHGKGCNRRQSATSRANGVHRANVHHRLRLEQVLTAARSAAKPTGCRTTPESACKPLGRSPRACEPASALQRSSRPSHPVAHTHVACSLRRSLAARPVPLQQDRLSLRHQLRPDLLLRGKGGG